MADEPRRSVRATKGQHTKKDDELQTPEPPKKRSKKATKKQEEEEVEVIRCVCGARETQPDDEEPWIACDSCEAWQHNVCMGISTFDEDVPEHYLCEKCSPQSHKDLLDGVVKGIMVWEDRRRAYEKAKEKEKEKPKKGGKKTKGAKRTSDPRSELSQSTNGKAKSPSLPASDKKEKKEVGKVTKRKEAPIEVESATKLRKLSAPPKSPSSELPIRISDIDPTRQGSVKLLQKRLLVWIPESITKGTYKLRPDDTAEAKSERLAIQLEDAIHKAYPVAAEYISQARSLAANLKANHELCNGLLSGHLSPDVLAVMTSDQLASKELQQERAEMKAKSDKQATLVTDDGPRVRRTHKGEEVVEDDNFAVPSDTTTATMRRRSELDPNGDMAARSRENSPMNEVELPENIGDYRSQDDIRSNATPKQPLKVETKSRPHVRKQSSTQDFDINKVFSSVQSPVGSQNVRRPSAPGNAPPANGPGVDLEIDKMLEDDGNDSLPYSPAEHSDPDTAWRGTLTMDTVAQFSVIAKHVGGADLKHQNRSWNDVLHRDLRVAGRIAEDKANEYLCSLRWAYTSDLVVISLTPSNDEGVTAHQALFQYFTEKKRYGVFTSKSPGNVRDTYLVPVPPSPAPLPDFLQNLEGHKLTGERPDPIMLVALVVRHDFQSEQRPHDGPQEAQSPSLMAHPQRQMSLSGSGPAISPVASQGAFPSPVRAGNINSDENRRHLDEQRRRDQAEGEATASRILGPLINAPTVRFLLPQAFQMRFIEWEVVRDILNNDPKAQHDLPHLSHLLEQRGPCA